MSALRVALAALLALAVPSVLAAQESGTAPAAATADEALAAAQDAYGPQDTRAKPKCGTPGPGGEIVVCGTTEDPDKYRVKSSEDLDPKMAKDVVPRAPDLYNLPVPAMVGVGVTFKGCFIPPCPAPMPLLIDLKKIPEAPPGSDADRVGKGLAPNGSTGQSAPGPTPAPAPAQVTEPALKPPESASPAEAPSG
jgi:hypothetical protein